MIQGSDKVIPKSYLKPFPPCIICKTISASAGMEGHPCSARMAFLDLPRHPYISAKDFCKSCRLTCTQARATQCINLSSWLSHGTLSENLCRYVSIYYIYRYIIWRMVTSDKAPWQFWILSKTFHPDCKIPANPYSVYKTKSKITVHNLCLWNDAQNQNSEICTTHCTSIPSGIQFRIQPHVAWICSGVLSQLVVVKACEEFFYLFPVPRLRTQTELEKKRPTFSEAASRVTPTPILMACVIPLGMSVVGPPISAIKLPWRNYPASLSSWDTLKAMKKWLFWCTVVCVPFFCLGSTLV